MSKAKVIAMPDALPSFILDRDEQARLAGLRLERHVETHKWGDTLITQYRGSRNQIAAAGFLWSKDPDDFHWPRGRCPSECRGGIFIPGACHYAGRVYIEAAKTFRVEVKEDCPSNLKRLNAQLERYEVHQNSEIQRIVHYGSRRALLVANIAQEDAFPDDPSCSGMRGDSWEWETTLAPNGNWAHQRNLDRERRAKERGREKDRLDLKDIDQYRETIEDMIVRFTRATVELYGSIETQYGYRYTADPARLADIVNSIGAAAQGLRNVPVKTVKILTEEEKARRGPVLRVIEGGKTDPLFQRFLRNIQSPRPDATQ